MWPNAGHVSLAQRRVMTAIEICRTAALGGHVERCEDCAHTRIAYNSCRNRHCPKCQWSAAERWLAARESELLPVAALPSRGIHRRDQDRHIMIRIGSARLCLSSIVAVSGDRLRNSANRLRL